MKLKHDMDLNANCAKFKKIAKTIQLL
jgi:hypothetical protein